MHILFKIDSGSADQKCIFLMIISRQNKKIHALKVNKYYILSVFIKTRSQKTETAISLRHRRSFPSGVTIKNV